MESLESLLAPGGPGRGLHSVLVDRFGRDIVTGRLAPGAVINPSALGAEHALSRTVVREALRTLAAKGLVSARPNRGTRVSDPARWHLLDPEVVAWIGPADDLDQFAAGLRVIGELLPGNRFYDHVMRTVGEAS